MAAVLAVRDEMVLPLRPVWDLAAAAGVPREEVVLIMQCASLDPKQRGREAITVALLELISPSLRWPPCCR